MPFPLIGIGAVAGAKAAAPAIASVAGGIAKFLKKKGVRKAIKTAKDVRDVVRAAEPAINEIARRKSTAADALGAAPANDPTIRVDNRKTPEPVRLLFFVGAIFLIFKLVGK